MSTLSGQSHIVSIIFIESIALVLFLLFNSDLRSSLLSSEETVIGLKRLLVYVYSLHKVKFNFGYWHITYTIDERGGAYTREEMAIEPIKDGEKVHFRQSVLGSLSPTDQEMIVRNLRISNKNDGKLLSYIELSNTSKRFEFAVILDPPSEKGKPTEIIIESTRSNVFVPLIIQFRDHGEFIIARNTPKIVEAKFIAPPNLEFVSLSIMPSLGICQVETMGNLSVAIWHGENIPDGMYSYLIQAKGRTNIVA